MKRAKKNKNQKINYDATVDAWICVYGHNSAKSMSRNHSYKMMDAFEKATGEAP